MKISIKVIPNAKQNEIAEGGFDESGARILKVRVNQAPEDGKANKAAVELLAKYFKVKKSAVSIIFGETSRNKIVEINRD